MGRLLQIMILVAAVCFSASAQDVVCSRERGFGAFGHPALKEITLTGGQTVSSALGLRDAESFVVSVIASFTHEAGMSVMLGASDSISITRSKTDSWNLFGDDNRIVVGIYHNGAKMAGADCKAKGKDSAELITIEMCHSRLKVIIDGKEVAGADWKGCRKDAVQLGGIGAGVAISRVLMRADKPLHDRLLTSYTDTRSLLDRLTRSADPLEGEWRMFTRNLDDAKLRVGGEYRLACVKEGSGYKLIYIEGAKVNPGRWVPGMLKGELKPTGFRGVWYVVWYDASGEPLSRDVTASITEEGYLLINFPYHHSEVTLRRPDVRVR